MVQGQDGWSCGLDHRIANNILVPWLQGSAHITAICLRLQMGGAVRLLDVYAWEKFLPSAALWVGNIGLPLSAG
jgi:hypothetical protein